MTYLREDNNLITGQPLLNLNTGKVFYIIIYLEYKKGNSFASYTTLQ